MCECFLFDFRFLVLVEGGEMGVRFERLGFGGECKFGTLVLTFIRVELGAGGGLVG